MYRYGRDPKDKVTMEQCVVVSSRQNRPQSGVMGVMGSEESQFTQGYTSVLLWLASQAPGIIGQCWDWLARR